MFACVWIGVPREKPNLALCSELDWPGLAYAGLGFSLLYAGLDQGNRLDWVRNGTVNGLLISGGLLTLLFVLRELWTPRPFLNIRLIVREDLPVLLAAAVRLSLHHPVDRLHHPDLSADRAEFP